MLDLSATALADARARLGARAAEIRWLEVDIPASALAAERQRLRPTARRSLHDWLLSAAR